MELPRNMILLSAAIESFNKTITETIKEEGKETRKVLTDIAEQQRINFEDKKHLLDNLNQRTLSKLEECTNEIRSHLSVK